MVISLSPELERRLAEAVAEGRFRDESEAVAEALRRLFDGEGVARTDLDAAVAIGLAEAERGEFVSGEEVQTEIRRRLAARRAG